VQLLFTADLEINSAFLFTEATSQPETPYKGVGAIFWSGRASTSLDPDPSSDEFRVALVGNRAPPAKKLGAKCIGHDLYWSDLEGSQS